MNELVSVVIPTYNRQKYLHKAIQTVLNQTYQHFEIVIVDDASVVDNKEIVDSFHDKRIRYFKNDEQRGAPYSRNFGIEQSKGKFVAFLDDDDEWEEEKLEKQMKEFEQLDVGLVICYSLDKRFGNKRISKPQQVITYKKLLKSFNLSSTSTYVIRKKIFNTTGGFDVDLPSAQEYDLAIRIAKYYTIRTIPEVLVIQNSSEGQISENWGKKIRGILGLYAKHSREYKVLGFKGCLMNHFKNIGLLFIFLLGFIIGNKIYRIIIPIKEVYEQ